MKNRGFTLIELLVVISIIAMLSSVVLASLASVRDKGRASAGIIFDTNMLRAMGDNAQFRFDFSQGNGGLTAYDVSPAGIGNNGTININSAWSIDTPNNRNYSINCGGTAYITTQKSVNFKGGVDAAESASIWFKTSASAGTLVFSSYGATRRLFGSGIFYLTSTPWIYNTFTLPKHDDEKWHNFAYTLKGTSAKTYFDGKLVESRTLSSNMAADNNLVTICANTAHESSSIFNGLVDDITFYGREITINEIQRLYAEGAKERGLVVR